MDWIKKHIDAAVIITVLGGGFLWIDSKFEKVNEKLSALDKDVSNIKTVLIMKEIMPPAFGASREEK